MVLLLSLGIAPAAAQNKENDAVKKTTDGVGRLFQGMGQEINKLGGSLTAPSKDGKKAKPAAESEEKKN